MPINKNILSIKFLGMLLLILTILIIFLYLQNNWITKTRLRINLQRLPKSFDRFKIIHISDLHNKSFGKNQKHLINQIKDEKPNIIVITGDLIDSRRYNEYIAMQFVKEAVKIAPVYYVTGNHEMRSGKFKSLEEQLINAGAKVLRNSWEKIDSYGQSIIIAGIDDPYTGIRYREPIVMDKYLQEIKEGLDENSFKILLSHRPERIDAYAAYGFDLVFSGHAHGGQFRIPFLGGLVVPNQGFLPKYTSGVHKVNNTTMVISRGLGNSIVPQRIFNRPEIIVAELLAK
ncbi:metallophosphoesterase [Proteiniborus sp. MB09-C3]|uniref:metallophosphoesterase n=1 Tax=Proteiniborus sp. MB09-C3 TaxID=3050072 RepID=UPI0025546F84|nr:metallophosphoesterase [Proteiniborus sp. MB09-C3]WIV13352.1 metallophosphoesterase [Proteiniborus sp. MB09-C3]